MKMLDGDYEWLEEGVVAMSDVYNAQVSAAAQATEAGRVPETVGAD